MLSHMCLNDITKLYVTICVLNYDTFLSFAIKILNKIFTLLNNNTAGYYILVVVLRGFNRILFSFFMEKYLKGLDNIFYIVRY